MNTKNLDNLAYKYNRFYIILIATLPFVSFIFFKTLGVTSARVMQLLSFVGVALLVLFSNNKNPIKIPKYLIFYFLFTLYVFFSAFIQLDREFKINYLFSNQLIGGINVIIIIENLPISKKFYNLIFKLSKNILIIAFIVIVYQQVFDHDFYMLHNEELDKSFLAGESKIRLKSIYSYIGYIGFGFAFLPIFFWVIEDLIKEKKNVLIWILIGIIYAFLTKSRWVMVNALLVFIILIVNNKNKILQTAKLLLIIPIFAFLTYMTLNSFGLGVDKIVQDRILESDKNENHKSATTRLLAFEVFNKLYWDNPVFGSGSVKYGMGGTGKWDYKLQKALGTRTSQIHVGYLSLLYMYGIIGGFFFLAFLYLILKKLYNSAKISGFWAPFLGLLGFAIANLTLVSFTIFEMGFIIVLFVDKYHRQNNNKIYIDA